MDLQTRFPRPASRFCGLAESRDALIRSKSTRHATRTRFLLPTRSIPTGPPLSPSRVPHLPCSQITQFRTRAHTDRPSARSPMATKCAAAADLPAARPRKRARHGWDVAPPTKERDSLEIVDRFVIRSVIRMCPVKGMIRIGPWSVASSSVRAVFSSNFAADMQLLVQNFAADYASLSLLSKGVARNASPPWREDDKDGHYVFAVGENLTSRCNYT